jgi:PAS domain S-box-containing protein
VATGVPVEAVFGPIRSTAAQNASVVLGFALLAGFLAWLGSRRLSSPLRQLMQAAKANSGGDLLARAPLALPGEFGELSTEFNRMLDARDSAGGHLREAEQLSRRMAAFYEALSKTNRAIASQLPPQEIFEAICRICVETDCAQTAWIALADGSEMRLAASAGWTGTAEDDSAVVLAEDGPTLTAFKRGRSTFIGDTATDPRVNSWKATATFGKAGSAAAFPVSRGGVVYAVLTLYVEQKDAFDGKLVRLIEEMAADASFGLDNYDKAIALGYRDSQLAAIVETATDAIITVDHLLNVKVFNGAAQRMFRVDAKTILGQRADTLVPSRFRKSAASGLELYMKAPGGSPLAGAAQEFVGLRLSGEEFPLQATFSRLGVAGGILVTIVVRDITALRESEKHLKAAATHEAANVAKTNFLSNMSHELRTPLTAVTGFAQLLLANTEDRLDAKERHQLGMILMAGRQLTALVDDVLDVSRIEAGRMGMSLQDLELHHLVDSVLHMCEESAAAHAVTLIRSYAGTSPLAVHSDPTRLRQVLLNVVTNAIKYNRRDGTVSVGIEEVDEVINITVKDTGLGLSEAQTDRLFEPFNRLGRERGEIPGTGLGLMLSRQLVELMGGSITLNSVEGVGTEVGVQLPALLPASQGTAESYSATASANEGAEGVQSSAFEPSGTVLYIEDNPVNVLLVEAVLKPWSHVKLIVAIDAAEGLAQAFAVAPDLILLDIHLPDADGLDVLRSLRAEPRTARLPIVALSASVMEWEMVAALEAGATKYWSKPIDFSAFRAGVSAYLREAAENSATELRIRESVY